VHMDASETAKLVEFSEEHKNTHHGGGTQGNDSDEEEGEGHGHGQRVRCAHQ